jgi:dCTP deaminase
VPAAAPLDAPGAILTDRELRELIGRALRGAPGAQPPASEEVQPASVDLRLGREAVRIRAGFVPADVPVEERLRELGTSRLSLEGDGAVLERGLVYLAPLEVELDLPQDVRGRFNPRSSWAGRPWLEIAPLSFPVRVRHGDRLCQLRLQRGRAGLDGEALRAAHAETPLFLSGGRPLADGELAVDEEGAALLRVGLEGRDPCGWRAALETEVVDFAATATHDPGEFWEPLRARSGHAVLDPGRFHLLASRERIRVPPHLAAEMLPVDVGIGELRNNYAGFFDCGFGWDARRADGGEGTPAVLEVRAHDVPFLVEDGQVLFRLRFFRVAGRPERLYGEDRPGPSYRGQDLTLARPFRPS